MAQITSTVTANDVGRYVGDKLITLSELLHRFPQACDDVALPEGMAKTANFILYNRSYVPVGTLTEGTTPSETDYTISQVTVTVEQWGLFFTLTDVVQLTTKHPVLNETIKLLADAVARVKDHAIVAVLNAGTNIQYWDGSVATRAALAATNTWTRSVFGKALATLRDAGAPERDGTYYMAIIGPQVEADIVTEAPSSTSAGFNNWEGPAQLMAKAGNTAPLEKGVIGAALGMKLIRTNFIPKFTLIATVSAPTPTTGGALSGTVYFKVTRKNLQRGFEEDIQAQGSQAMSTNTRLPFIFPATAGYVYNVYAGSATGDANLFLAAENQVASATYNLDALPTSGNTPPATPPSGVTVHPIYVFGKEAVNNVKLDGSAIMGVVTPAGASDSDPLIQRRKAGSKWMVKAGIRRSFAHLRIELASAY